MPCKVGEVRRKATAGELGETVGHAMQYGGVVRHRATAGTNIETESGFFSTTDSAERGPHPLDSVYKKHILGT